MLCDWKPDIVAVDDHDDDDDESTGKKDDNCKRYHRYNIMIVIRMRVRDKGELEGWEHKHVISYISPF